MQGQDSKEAMCILLQICTSLFKILLHGCRGRLRSDMKELHVDLGCAGLLCGVTGQWCATLFLWGALVSRVSWKPFSRVEMWR